MLIRFRCPACRQFLGISDRRAGDAVRCPRCGENVRVPAGEEEEFRLRRATTEFEEMDLTPMVDVTFLLLIFFMLTASFTLAKSIEVPTPDPEEQGARQSIPREQLESRSIMVRIDEHNAVYVDDVLVDDPGRLEDLLVDRMRAERKSEMVIEADDRALHRTVVLVKDAATGAGMQTVRLARLREGGNP